MTWTPEEKKQIFEAYSIQVDGANKYGEKPNIKANLRVLEAMFAERFTGEQVVKVIYSHMLKSTEIIKPAHIEAILNPPPVKITQAEYIEACKQHQNEGRPLTGYYKTKIDAYDKQEGSAREEQVLITGDIKKMLPTKRRI